MIVLSLGGPTTRSASGTISEYGGVCAIDTWSGNTMYEAVGGDKLDIQIHAVMPHPHLDDTFYVGGIWASGATRAPGLFALQRRYRPDTSPPVWAWAFRSITGDDLEHRKIMDIDWGTGASTSDALQHLYLTAAGGGFWDATIQAE